MDGEDIDGSSLTELRVRHLDRRLPSRRLQHRHDRRNKRRVALVAEAVDGASTPRRIQIQPRINGPEGALKSHRRDALEVPPLDPRPRCLADASAP